ncbi:DUF2252 domain-containing protein [Nitrospirillum sp. BR 11163]|uniref:DUF2252 domain-containing protein n=1 Tax=Nitrospirillum sp. BR 11163 TaxID=3104323 RepID=UPI002AFE1359|nr:DUF2252 domain-containing protein [Nitrospirillum sp. BR 11163]MEA1674011.1 DUF2252 domain-containing protein [Nitrospirillum sp. BR 11163]
MPDLAAPNLAGLRALPADKRKEAGKALRDAAPRSGNAALPPLKGRADPIALLVTTSASRIQSLLPVRWARMAASPFTFLRGSAAVMARDLGQLPVSGIRVQASGDCHLMNFGVYASPEGRPVFDLNDFDETLSAPFEWDVKRLAASLVLAARDAGHAPGAAKDMARAAVTAYRLRMAELAALDPLTAWSSRVDIAAMAQCIKDEAAREKEMDLLAKAAATPSAGDDFPRLAQGGGREARIRDAPPLIYHFDEETDRQGQAALRARALFTRYRDTLPEERRFLIDRYQLADVAFKVVGVGSVGTFCAIGLFVDPDGHPLFLQVKEATASVLAPYAGASPYANQGQRVVVGQRTLQTVSDGFLGWAADDAGRHFYIRQLKDRRLASAGTLMEGDRLDFYATLCGATLARAHARSGDAALIAGYLGNSSTFDDAVADFAAGYAGISAADHALLKQAITDGRLAVADLPSKGKGKGKKTG